MDNVSDYSKSEALKNGVLITIRAVHPEDKKKFIDGLIHVTLSLTRA